MQSDPRQSKYFVAFWLTLPRFKLANVRVAADRLTYEGPAYLVVVGNAIARGNVELEEVLDRKIRYCSLPEAIRDHFLWGARSIVIHVVPSSSKTIACLGVSPGAALVS